MSSEDYPSVEELAKIVHEYGQDLELETGESDLDGDIRIKIHNGYCEVFTGDPSYDQDHRGFWGSSCVPPGCSHDEARDISLELISGAKDMEAQSRGLQ